MGFFISRKLLICWYGGVFPSIGKLPVRDITPAHVLDILTKTVKRGAPTVAAEAKRTLSGIFELAVATLRADNDPVWPVRKALPANKTQHKPALSKEQIGKLLSDFANHRYGYQVNFCMQLMWWKLARPSAAAEAEWAEFDLDAALWTIPARRMKARREHGVPLPTQAVDMLRRLHAISGDRMHLFPGRDDRNRPMSVHSIRRHSRCWAGAAPTARMAPEPRAAPALTRWAIARTPSKRSLPMRNPTRCTAPITMPPTSKSGGS